jgi:hypothetical protein
VVLWGSLWANGEKLFPCLSTAGFVENVSVFHGSIQGFRFLITRGCAGFWPYMKPVFNSSQHAYSYSFIYPSLEEKEKKRLIGDLTKNLLKIQSDI